jgi:hypothetical protein
MKEIKIYNSSKYNSNECESVAPNIYKIYDDFVKSDRYVTSISFVQEPEYGEGDGPKDISQYPLEDICDKFYIAVNDFYEKKNEESENVCYLEFSGSEIEDIQNFLSIVGKHVYNREIDGYIQLIIE